MQAGSRKEPPFVFDIQAAGLAAKISKVLIQPTLTEYAEQAIQRGRHELSTAVEAARLKNQARPGCLLFLGVGIAAGAALVRLIV